MKYRLKVFACLVLFANYSYADSYPFYLNNQNPFIQIFGLPKAEPPDLNNINQYSSITSLNIVNNTVQGDTNAEKLVLDGESYRMEMAVRYGIWQDTEIGVDVPIVSHRRGRFDNFIRNWHDLFGLSNKEQNQFTPNQLNYYYQSGSNTVVDIHETESGLGDVRLSVAMTGLKYIPWAPQSFVYRAVIKLPTGNADTLLGSGGIDVALSMSTENSNTFKDYYSAFSGQAGVMWLGESDLFSQIQRKYVMFASSTIDWDYWQPIVFKAQLDLHTSFYRSEIGDLGKDSIQLTVGGAVKFNKDMHFDIGVSENLMSDSTPDVGLNLTLWMNI